MRLLFITPQLPFPPHKGTSLRNFYLIKGLADRHEISLLSFAGSPDVLAGDSPLGALCRKLDVAPAPRRGLAARARDTLLSPWPDMGLRLWSPVFAGKLHAWLAQERYDVLQVEGIEMARYALNVRASTGAFHVPKIIFDDHNCEYLLQQRTFETDARQVRRWLGAAYSFIQWQKLRRFEAQICRMADAVSAVSDADAAALERLVAGLNASVVPNGIALSEYQSSQARTVGEQPANLVFVGTMDFRPNVDAVLWFATEVLPFILAQAPQAHFYVVGARPHQRLDSLRDNQAITITGGVDDVRPYIEMAAVCVVPLRMGGGTRFKILEAAALRKALVSTSLGCEGFPLQDGRELLIADAPADFAAAVLSLLRDPARRVQLEQAAYAMAEAFDWQRITPRLEAMYARVFNHERHETH